MPAPTDRHASTTAGLDRHAASHPLPSSQCIPSASPYHSSTFLLPLSYPAMVLLLLLSCGQVACGSGLELIYEFLQSDESANRPDLLKNRTKKVRQRASASVRPCANVVMAVRNGGWLRPCRMHACWRPAETPDPLFAGFAVRASQANYATPRPPPRSAPPDQVVKEISAAALDGSDPLAVEAVDLLFAIVGAEAGAMALRCLAKGGCCAAPLWYGVACGGRWWRGKEVGERSRAGWAGLPGAGSCSGVWLHGWGCGARASGLTRLHNSHTVIQVRPLPSRLVVRGPLLL